MASRKAVSSGDGTDSSIFSNPGRTVSPDRAMMSAEKARAKRSFFIVLNPLMRFGDVRSFGCIPVFKDAFGDGIGDFLLLVGRFQFGEFGCIGDIADFNQHGWTVGVTDDVKAFASDSAVRHADLLQQFALRIIGEIGICLVVLIGGTALVGDG